MSDQSNARTEVFRTNKTNLYDTDGLPVDPSVKRKEPDAVAARVMRIPSKPAAGRFSMTFSALPSEASSCNRLSGDDWPVAQGRQPSPANTMKGSGTMRTRHSISGVLTRSQGFQGPQLTFAADETPTPPGPSSTRGTVLIVPPHLHLSSRHPPSASDDPSALSLSAAESSPLFISPILQSLHRPARVAGVSQPGSISTAARTQLSDPNVAIASSAVAPATTAARATPSPSTGESRLGTAARRPPPSRSKSFAAPAQKPAPYPAPSVPTPSLPRIPSGHAPRAIEPPTAALAHAHAAGVGASPASPQSHTPPLSSLPSPTPAPPATPPPPVSHLHSPVPPSSSPRGPLRSNLSFRRVNAAPTPIIVGSAATPGLGKEASPVPSPGAPSLALSQSFRSARFAALLEPTAVAQPATARTADALPAAPVAPAGALVSRGPQVLMTEAADGAAGGLGAPSGNGGGSTSGHNPNLFSYPAQLSLDGSGSGGGSDGGAAVASATMPAPSGAAAPPSPVHRRPGRRSFAGDTFRQSAIMQGAAPALSSPAMSGTQTRGSMPDELVLPGFYTQEGHPQAAESAGPSSSRRSISGGVAWPIWAWDSASNAASPARSLQGGGGGPVRQGLFDSIELYPSLYGTGEGFDLAVEAEAEEAAARVPDPRRLGSSVSRGSSVAFGGAGGVPGGWEGGPDSGSRDHIWYTAAELASMEHMLAGNGAAARGAERGGGAGVAGAPGAGALPTPAMWSRFRTSTSTSGSTLNGGRQNVQLPGASRLHASKSASGIAGAGARFRSSEALSALLLAGAVAEEGPPPAAPSADPQQDRRGCDAAGGRTGKDCASSGGEQKEEEEQGGPEENEELRLLMSELRSGVTADPEALLDPVLDEVDLDRQAARQHLVRLHRSVAGSGSVRQRVVESWVDGAGPPSVRGLHRRATESNLASATGGPGGGGPGVAPPPALAALADQLLKLPSVGLEKLQDPGRRQKVLDRLKTAYEEGPARIAEMLTIKKPIGGRWLR